MKFGKNKTPKAKTVSKAEAEKAEVQETVNLDKMVEEHKTSGTEFQAYMRDRIKKA